MNYMNTIKLRYRMTSVWLNPQTRFDIRKPLYLSQLQEPMFSLIQLLKRLDGVELKYFILNVFRLHRIHDFNWTNLIQKEDPNNAEHLQTMNLTELQSSECKSAFGDAGLSMDIREHHFCATFEHDRGNCGVRIDSSDNFMKLHNNPILKVQILASNSIFID